MFNSETNTTKVIRYHYGVQATKQHMENSTQTSGTRKIYERVRSCLEMNSETFGQIMSSINEYFFETDTNNTHEAVFLANYVLSKGKL